MSRLALYHNLAVMAVIVVISVCVAALTGTGYGLWSVLLAGVMVRR